MPEGDNGRIGETDALRVSAKPGMHRIPAPTFAVRYGRIRKETSRDDWLKKVRPIVDMSQNKRYRSPR